MNSQFGSRELAKCLQSLGFIAQPQVGSRHLKYKCPKKHKKGERDFLIVLQGKKSYDPKTCKKILHQIKKHEFTEDKIVAAF